MSEAPKPIRRREELAPLSREHHQVLLFAWKVRQGLQNGTNPEVIARFADWYWTTALQPLFRQEEAVLLPYLPADHPLVVRMLDEHQQVEAWIHINEQIADAELLAQLAQAVHDHVRFEERELFPLAEQLISPEDLQTIHGSTTAPKEAAPAWPEPFWERK